MPWDPDHPGVPAGIHDIATARWNGGCFTDQQVVYQEESLLDPVICAHPSTGDWWLLSSAPGLQLRGASGSSPDSFTSSFLTDHGSVPFCYPDGSELRLLSQMPDGLYSLIRSHITAEGQYQEDGPLFEKAPFPNCTSPVLTQEVSVWSLFCAVWTTATL
jgi:hypothetical protein